MAARDPRDMDMVRLRPLDDFSGRLGLSRLAITWGRSGLPQLVLFAQKKCSRPFARLEGFEHLRILELWDSWRNDTKNLTEYLKNFMHHSLRPLRPLAELALVLPAIS